MLPVIGVSAAIQPLLGYNYGARLISRVRTTLWQGVLVATVLATLFWAMVHLFPTQIVELFGITNPDLLTFTIFALQVQLLLLPLCGFQITGANYFQATGQPLKSTMLSLSRQVIFLIPLLLILPMVLPSIAPQYTGLDAVYFATPVADFLAIFTTVLFIIAEMRRLKKIERGELEIKI